MRIGEHRKALARASVLIVVAEVEHDAECVWVLTVLVSTSAWTRMTSAGAGSTDRNASIIACRSARLTSSCRGRSI